MRIKIFLLLSFLLLCSATFCQIPDSSKRNISLSHYFSLGGSYLIGEQYPITTTQSANEVLISPYNLNIGYDLGLNFGEYFLLETGIQYCYRPYIFNFRYYDSSSPGYVEGKDELNIQYHSIYLRIRPGVRFKIGKLYETSILGNISYGFNSLGNYSHTNLTPQYAYTLTYGESKNNFTHYVAPGIHWMNMFKINTNISLGIDLGYQFQIDLPYINDIFYNDDGIHTTVARPKMYHNALMLNFVIKYK